MDRRVDFLISHLKRDMRGRLSVRTMARRVNLSASRLSHLFKQELQMSLQQYIKLTRMRHAQFLLESSFLTVKQVMASSGLNDMSHFVRDFKRLYGATPGRYRRRYGKSSASS